MTLIFPHSVTNYSDNIFIIPLYTPRWLNIVRNFAYSILQQKALFLSFGEWLLAAKFPNSNTFSFKNICFVCISINLHNRILKLIK